MIQHILFLKSHVNSIAILPQHNEIIINTCQHSV